MPSDYEELYSAEVMHPRRLFAYRHRGVPPSAEGYPQSLWEEVFVQFAVESTTDHSFQGLVTCYAYDPRNQTAKVALSSAVSEGPSSGLLAFRGFLLFLNVVFTAHPIRKIYAEVLEWNLDQFSSLQRLGAQLEGRLIGHELWGESEIDLLIFGLTRGAFKTHRSHEGVVGEVPSQGGLSAEGLCLLELGAETLDDVSWSELDSLGRVSLLTLLEDELHTLIPESLGSASDEDFRQFIGDLDSQGRSTAT